MLIFDELKKNDLQLRTVAMVLAGGFFLLLAGLWWVQVVSARTYQNHFETQAYRSVRLPAVRGKILDRTGLNVLAENRPRYNLSLYLDDLRPQFDDVYSQLRKDAIAAQKLQIAAQEKKLGRSLTKAELKQFRLTSAQFEQLRTQARCSVAGGVVAEVGRWLGQPIVFDAAKFNRHYATQLAMPYVILPDLNDSQIARFEEHFSGGLGADLEPEFLRVYPFGTTAAHLLGYVQRNDDSANGEEAFFSYRLPDYRGQVGIEGGFDAQLRGRAGGESVVVNNLGYRESENVWSQPEAGHNIVLTLDLGIQRAAEVALAAHHGADALAAAVVMDVRTGDVLAMASSPAINPDYSLNDPARMADAQLRPQINRATQEKYAPGSIFKVVIGLAALEKGLDPKEEFDNTPNPQDPAHGHAMVGNRIIRDTAPPGEYDFRLAIMRSSNFYFITNGLRAGIDNIVSLAEKFHFGEKTGIPTRQETRGDLPTMRRIHNDWHDGDTANVCIGQGEIAVTPLQMAVAYSAIANGGTVLRPRLVERIEPQDPASGETATNFPAGIVRDELGVSPRSLKILHDAMLAETEDPEGTGGAARVTGLRICGKTGTAQVQDSAMTRTIGYNYWFGSFAPYEKPKYAVVVMVQIPGPMQPGGGGRMCAPMAHDIYKAILQSEQPIAPKAVAKN